MLQGLLTEAGIPSVLKRTAALTKWKFEADKYPGYIRRVRDETPEDLREHEHPDEEL